MALAAAVAYLAVRGELRAEIDRALEDQLLVRRAPPERRGPGPGFGPLPAGQGGPTPYMQIVDSGGNVLRLIGTEPTELPVQERARDAAAGVGTRYFADADVEGTHVRVLTVPLAGGLAVQFGRSLESADAVLDRLRLVLVLVVLGGVALAVALGRVVSRNVVAPIAHVTEAARHIAATEDLGRRIEVETQDEIGELAAHFNAMLDTLERSVAAQRQLVADASHELRTPITSLRTNIEVLADAEALPPDERERLLADVEEQIDGAGDAGRGPDRARPRRRAAPRDRGRAARRPRRGGRRPGEAPRPERALRRPARARGGRGHARAARARRQQPARQRRAPFAAGRRGRGARRHAGRARARPRHGRRRRKTSRTCSTASTAARRRAGARAQGSAWRSCGRSRSSTAAACTPRNAAGGGAEFVLELPAVSLSPAA